MFQSLQDIFKKTFDKIAGRGRLSEADVRDAAREIKLALLSADVHFGVVKDFVEGISAKAVGKEVLESITPAQQFTKIVYDELVRVLGGESVPFDFASETPLITMMVGLQGSGKTTSAARLALFCKKNGRRPFLIPADVHRPAAIEQLQILAKQIEVDCWQTAASAGAVKAVTDAMDHAKKIGYDTAIVDTAGRLHIDEEMMNEVKEIAGKVSPQRVLYVADSMTGQDAVKSARAFDEALAITGVILTKLDGDARGGAALSVRHVTGKPIIFAGVGEHLTDLEPFYPDRMAGRILGMGDVVSLVEEVQSKISSDEAMEAGQAMLGKRFTLEDFLKQLKLMKKMGPLEKVLGLLPGVGGLVKEINSSELEKELKHKEAIVQSMTREERINPRILNGSRRKRISRGCGLEVSAINRFIKEFDMMEKMMKKFSRGGLRNVFKGLTNRGFS